MAFYKSSASLLAITVVSACGGASNTVLPVFAGPDLITTADYVGKTFPLRFVGANASTAELHRGTGTITVVGPSALQITIDGVSGDLIEFGSGSFGGSVFDGELEEYADELISIQVSGTSDEYLTFLGFETDPSVMPASDSALFLGNGTSTIYISNGALIDTLDGSVVLNVDFGTGNVTGDLFSTVSAVFELRNGMVSGNGFSGEVQVLFSNGSGGFDETPTSNSDVDGVFFGNDASLVAGTFEATYEDGLTYSAVGAFASELVPP